MLNGYLREHCRIGQRSENSGPWRTKQLGHLNCAFNPIQKADAESEAVECLSFRNSPRHARANLRNYGRG